MSTELAVKPRFLTDEHGQKQAVVLSLEEFQSLLDIIEDIKDAKALDDAIANSTGEFVDLDDLIDEMREDGLL